MVQHSLYDLVISSIEDLENLETGTSGYKLKNTYGFQFALIRLVVETYFNGCLSHRISLHDISYWDNNEE